MSKRIRVLFPCNGHNVGYLRMAIKLTLEELVRNGGDGVLLVPTLSNVDGGGLEEALGSSLTKTLLTKRIVRIADGVNLRLETERTLKQSDRSTVILGVYVDDGSLDKVEALYTVKSIIVVPWLEADVERWKKTWSPLVYGQEQAKGNRASVSNPVVEEGLKALTGSINLSTGLGHPNDRGRAIELFDLLKANGEEFDPAEIRIWASQNKWSANAAEELMQVASAVKAGNRIKRGRGPFWSATFIDTLKARTTQP